MAKAKNKTRFNFGYGAIYQRKTKTGTIRWYLDYKDANGERIQKVAPLATNQDEAAYALREEVTREFDAEYRIRRETEKISFPDFSAMFLEEYSKIWKKSWKSDQSYLQANLIPFFHERQMVNIRQADIEKYIVHRKKEGVEDSTVNRELACLRKMFNKAMDWGYLEKNPVARIQFFSEKNNMKERVLTEDEEKRLLNSCNSVLNPILITALQTGMRRGEILSLRWSDVDIDQKEITLSNTKSGRSRVIPINNELLDVFYQLLREKVSDIWVFLNPRTKEPFKDVKKSFHGACARAGIKNLRFHDLRHTFASRLVQRGVDLITVKDLLGHSSVRITERYTHSNKSLKAEAVGRLARKRVKTARNDVDLLRICDTEESLPTDVPVKGSISIN